MSIEATFDKTMDVYSVDQTTGAYTVAEETGLACRLSTISSNRATSAPERAELASLRHLYWDASYDLSAYAQVEIDSVRWNPVAGTMVAPTHPRGGAILYRACDVIRAS